jgi:hypothetical protein
LANSDLLKPIAEINSLIVWAKSAFLGVLDSDFRLMSNLIMLGLRVKESRQQGVAVMGLAGVKRGLEVVVRVIKRSVDVSV